MGSSSAGDDSDAFETAGYNHCTQHLIKYVYCITFAMTDNSSVIISHLFAFLFLNSCCAAANPVAY